MYVGFFLSVVADVGVGVGWMWVWGVVVLSSCDGMGWDGVGWVFGLINKVHSSFASCIAFAADCLTV